MDFSKHKLSNQLSKELTVQLLDLQLTCELQLPLPKIQKAIHLQEIDSLLSNDINCKAGWI